MLAGGLSVGTGRLGVRASANLARPARTLAVYGGARARHSHSGPPAAKEDEQFPVKLPDDATPEQVQKMRDIQKQFSKRFVEGGRYALGNMLPDNVKITPASPLPRPVPLPIRKNIKVRRTGKSKWENFMTPKPNGDGTSTVPIQNSTRGRVHRGQLGTKPLTVPIKPAAQAVAQTEAPHNVVELVKRYPRHPLLKFFDLIPVSEAEHSIKYRGPVTKENDEKHKEEYGNILVPVTLHEGMLGRDPSFRPWETSELRLKSSFELHQLWYLCVFERNKLSSAWAEVKRIELKEAFSLAQQNITYRLYQLRWTQTRIKQVLLERSEALLDAQAMEKAKRQQLERETLAEASDDIPRRGRQYRRRADEPPAGAFESSTKTPSQPQAQA